VNVKGNLSQYANAKIVLILIVVAVIVINNETHNLDFLP